MAAASDLSRLSWAHTLQPLWPLLEQAAASRGAVAAATGQLPGSAQPAMRVV
jgi:hypothetical protein